jgi:hypothetical protein
MNFDFSHRREIDHAYIITIDDPVSLEFSERCQRSCEAVGMPYIVWSGFDGTKDGDIIVPDHSINKDYLNWIKVQDNRITKSQLACALSHFSLWCHCLTIDQPLVILEHDAVMLRPLRVFNFYNMIQFLGCKEQVQLGWPSASPIPPHATAYNKKMRCICRAHAYAIDPAISRNLISRFIQNGVFATTTADLFMRADIFAIVQNGIYAYDENPQDRSTVQELEL